MGDLRDGSKTKTNNKNTLEYWNDHVIVKTLNGREIKGIFMQIEFARCLEEDDIVHVHKDNGENEGIPFDTIDDIIKG